jgi:transporter family-2 protein
MTNVESLNGFILYAVLMIFAGLGIPVMAAINGGLGVKLQNPAMATSILLIVGSLISIGYLFCTTGLTKLYSPDVPYYMYMGGFFVIFYILSITWVSPKFGIGNAISFVLLGQLISMALIDHFRLLGAIHNPITFQRLFGIVLMAIGVFLAVRRT